MGMRNLKKLLKKIDDSEIYIDWGGKTPTEYFRELRQRVEKGSSCART